MLYRVSSAMTVHCNLLLETNLYLYTQISLSEDILHKNRTRADEVLPMDAYLLIAN
jgi:hypothetical protein